MTRDFRLLGKRKSNNRCLPKARQYATETIKERNRTRNDTALQHCTALVRSQNSVSKIAEHGRAYAPLSITGLCPEEQSGTISNCQPDALVLSNVLRSYLSCLSYLYRLLKMICGVWQNRARRLSTQAVMQLTKAYYGQNADDI